MQNVRGGERMAVRILSQIRHVGAAGWTGLVEPLTRWRVSLPLFKWVIIG